MNKHFRLFILLVATGLALLAAQSTCAQAPPVDWAVPCASGPAPYVWGPSKLAVDRQGNTYVAGAFNGTTVIGPGILTAVPSTEGAYAGDVFVAKLNAQGQYLWAVSAGGNKLDLVKGLAVDALGDVYVTGSFESFSLGFGAGGPVLFNSSARSEWFVAKLSGATGQWLWARRAGGVYADEGTGIAVNAAGEVYVAGYVSGPSGTACDFGPLTLTSAGAEDIVVAKLSNTGTWLWARQSGGSAREQVTNMLLDGIGNIYVTGFFASSFAKAGTTTLGTSALQASHVVGSPSTGAGDLFVGKLDGTGNWLWAVQGDAVNGQNLAGTVGLAADGLGHLYVAGTYANQSVRLGNLVLPNLSVMQPPQVPAPPVPYTNNYHTDVFVARLDAATGAWQWAVRAGGSQRDELSTLVADPQGRVYVGARGRPGVFEGFANPLTPNGGPVYSAELAGATGAWRWTAPEGAWTLATDATGRLYVGGNFDGAAVTLGTTTLASAGPGLTTGYVMRRAAGPLSAGVAAPGMVGLAVWPNPAGSGAVWVQGPDAGQAVRVLDVLGRTVAQGRMPATGPLTLPLALPTGVYVVRADGQVRRLVVE